MTASAFKSLALSFPQTTESPHFERAAFKVAGKKIFATLHAETSMATLKLSEIDQSVFCDLGKKSVYPVPNKWGAKGWTIFEIKKLPKELVWDALDTAYKEIMKSKR